MKRSEAISIGDIIKNVIKQQNLEGRLLEQRVVDLWPTIVGSVINGHTSNRYVSHGVLYVYITSAPIKNELSLYKSRLIKSLNEAAGGDVITDIVIR